MLERVVFLWQWLIILKMLISFKTLLPLHEICWDETSTTESVERDAVIMMFNFGAQFFVWKLENKHYHFKKCMYLG